MPDANMTDEEREHLRSLADQAKREMSEQAGKADPPTLTPDQEEMVRHLKDQIADLEGEDHGYDIPTPPAPDAVSEDGEDTRTPVPTAFLVYVDPASGSAIATDEIEKVLGLIKIERPAELVDFRRYCAEVVDQINVVLTTQSVVQTQMQMAQQMQQQIQSAQVAQNLGDLRNIRGGKRR